MAPSTVGVDVIAHKEERNATDTKKTKLRVRYYVEIVVGPPRENHTRLGFSGSFQALMRLHREFVRLYTEKHGEPHLSGFLTGRESFLSSSSSASRSSVSSTSKESSTSLSSLVRHTFGMSKKKKQIGEEEDGAINSQHVLHSHHHHQQLTVAQEPTGIAPFPAQSRVLVHLESGEAKDDAKIEARNAALFGYYSQLLNSDEGEMYLQLIHQRSQERAHKNKNENQIEEEASSTHSGGRFRKLLGSLPKNEDITSSKHIEFLEPVYVRAKGKSRGRRPTRRTSSQKAP